MSPRRLRSTRGLDVREVRTRDLWIVEDVMGNFHFAESNDQSILARFDIHFLLRNVGLRYGAADEIRRKKDS